MSQTPKTDKHPATSFPSLSDILANSSSSKRSTRSSIRTATSGTSLIPSLEDLKQKLEGSHNESYTKLNLSRAFGGLPSSFRFESNLNSQDLQSSSLLASSTSNDNYEYSNNVNDLNAARQKRQSKPRNFQTKSEPGGFINTVHSDTQREIAQLIKKIEVNEHLNFKDEDVDDKNAVHNDQPLPDFNLIQLPIDFNLDKGQVNVYQSGIIEIVSGDQPPIKFRMRQAKKGSKPLTTDLILTTENQVIIEPMNVCVPETLPN